MDGPNGSHFFIPLATLFFNYSVKNPRTKNAPIFLTHIISGIDLDTWISKLLSYLHAARINVVRLNIKIVESDFNSFIW